MSPDPTVQYISEWVVKPKYTSEDSEQPIYLTPWDLPLLSVNYNQKGLLFVKPSSFNDDENSINELLQRLRDSLSLTLVYFYPLAGRLATLKQENPPMYSVYIDCTDCPGAKFIHASVDSTVSDVLSPSDVPKVVHSFFDHYKAINHDGHSLPLLTVQLTDLIDGVFIGFSANHLVVDGTSFWHFINSWSEIFNAKSLNVVTISRHPIQSRWFPGQGKVNLPFNHPDEFIDRFEEAPVLRERFFHFRSESLKKLKSEANGECNSTKISTLQALVAHLWRCITRARRLPTDQETTSKMSMNIRAKLEPPLSENHFGNYIQSLAATTTAGELLGHGLGYAASLLHQVVIIQTDRTVRERVCSWLQSPSIVNLSRINNHVDIMMGSSPWFDMYGNEFGLGRPVAVRSGHANKLDGKMMVYPGAEGGGSLDLEVCLAPDSMSALESDPEFVDSITLSTDG